MRKIKPAFYRFIDKVNINVSGCWIWAGVKGGSKPSIYGYFRPGTKLDDPKIPAHRFIYEHLNGPIPNDFEIDHLCENKLCVNPSHLEAVTHKENMNRINWSRFDMDRNPNRDSRGRFSRIEEGSSYRM